MRSNPNWNQSSARWSEFDWCSCSQCLALQCYPVWGGISPFALLCHRHWLGAWPGKTAHSSLSDTRCPLSQPHAQSVRTPRNSFQHIRSLDHKKSTEIRDKLKRDAHSVELKHNITFYMRYTDFWETFFWAVMRTKFRPPTSCWDFIWNVIVLWSVYFILDFSPLPLMVGPRTPSSPISFKISRLKTR